jgi:hypothetical protein
MPARWRSERTTHGTNAGTDEGTSDRVTASDSAHAGPGTSADEATGEGPLAWRPPAGRNAQASQKQQDMKAGSDSRTHLDLGSWVDRCALVGRTVDIFRHDGIHQPLVIKTLRHLWLNFVVLYGATGRGTARSADRPPAQA